MRRLLLSQAVAYKSARVGDLLRESSSGVLDTFYTMGYYESILAGVVVIVFLMRNPRK